MNKGIDLVKRMHKVGATGFVSSELFRTSRKL